MRYVKSNLHLNTEVFPMEIYIILMFIAAAASLWYIGATLTKILK